MEVKIAEMDRFSKRIKDLFDDKKTSIVAFDDSFDEPFETNVWMPQMNAVAAVIDTFSLRKESKEETRLRNAEMHAELPILTELEYKIGVCRDAGTITDSLESFGISAFRTSINTFKIVDFHECYLRTIDKVNANHVALADKGFDAAMVTSIKTHHDNAYNIQNNKGDIKIDISDLSIENKEIIMSCYRTDMRVLKVMRTYGKARGDDELYNQSTINAVLSTIRPTPAKEPRVRVIDAGKDIVLRTDLNKKNVLQLELLTQGGVEIGLTELKTDEVIDGTALKYKIMMELMKKDLTGSGRYVKLRNMNLNKKAKVRVFEVKVVK